MYYIKTPAAIYHNLTFEDAEKLKKEIEWEYVGTMEGLETENKLKTLKKGERLK